MAVIAAHTASAHAWFAALVAFLALSACASGSYVLNDILDLPHDRAHPTKKRRPLASGRVAIERAAGLSMALIVAGLAGFIVGQTLNAWVVVAIKERTKVKHLWARLVGSTFVGQLGDTLVFCTIAASAIGISTFKDFAVYTALGWVYKTAVEVVMLPITYRVIAVIKRREPTYQLVG